MKNLGDYVTVSVAAELLGVSANTVRAWADRGKLPAYKNPANGYRIFRRSEIASFLNELHTSSCVKDDVVN